MLILININSNYISYFKIQQIVFGLLMFFLKLNIVNVRIIKKIIIYEIMELITI